jgi:cobyrinic acid a,c-diamide synthase
MNQITDIARTSSTYAAMALARTLAMQGKTPSQIAVMTEAAGFDLAYQDAFEVWQRCRAHHEDVAKALGAGE